MPSRRTCKKEEQKDSILISDVVHHLLVRSFVVYLHKGKNDVHTKYNFRACIFFFWFGSFFKSFFSKKILRVRLIIPRKTKLVISPDRFSRKRRWCFSVVKSIKQRTRRKSRPRRRLKTSRFLVLSKRRSIHTIATLGSVAVTRLS